MSTVINLRGTGGSGKSTVVTRIMELYECKGEHVIGRKRPRGYNCTSPVAPRPLFIPGHYETACGGCDTVKTVNEVYDMVNSAVDRGMDVLFEGIMVQDDVRRAVELDQRLKRGNLGTLTVIGLSTPIDECLKSIVARREARGDDRVMDPRNTMDRAKRQQGVQSRLRQSGVRVERLDREAAYQRVYTLLRGEPTAS